MAYQYDLFISYKTNPDWNLWTREHICGMLKSYLSDDLPHPPRIFIDDHAQTGEDWVNGIGAALGCARILLAVFTLPYFTSQWCLHELDLMHKRLLSMTSHTLIFPVIAGGTLEMLPPEIERLQAYDLKRFRLRHLSSGTPRFEDFSQEIKKLSFEIAAAINQAPPYNPAWEQDCKKRFNDVYRARRQGNRIPLETLTLKALPQQTTVPKPIL
jgi:hypothetical protein